MAVAFRSNTIATSTQTGTEPAGATTDDIIIASVYVEDPLSVVISPPAGWSNVFGPDTISAQVVTVDTFSNWQTSYWWIRRGSSAPSYVWTKSGGSGYGEVLTIAYSGAVNTGNPFSFANEAVKNTAGNTYPDTSGTTNQANEMLVWIGNNLVGNNAGTFTPPSGFTIRSNIGGQDTVAAEKAQAAAGATGTLSASGLNSSGGAMAFVCGLSPTAISNAVNANAQVATAVGTAYDAQGLTAALTREVGWTMGVSHVGQMVVGAYDPGVVSGNAPAQTIADVGTSYAPLIQLRPNASTIAATGTANNATASTAAATNAPAGLATAATGTAYAPLIQLQASAALPTASGTAYGVGTVLAAYEFYPFTQADGVASGWTATSGLGAATTTNLTVSGNQVKSVGQHTAGQGSGGYKTHSLNITGSTDWRIDVQVDTALYSTYGGINVIFANLASGNGYGFFVGNAMHVQRYAAGVSTNLTNDGLPGSNVNTTDHAANWLTLIHKANGDMETLLNGVHLGSITDTTHAAVTFDTLVGYNYSNISGFDSVLDNLLISEGLVPAITYPPLDSGTPGVATATSTSYNPVAQLKPNAETIAASGTAYNPSTSSVTSTNAPAGLATGTGAAYAPIAQLRSNAETISTIGTANSPTALVAASAQTISASGTAYGAIVQLRSSAQTIAGAGTAYGPSITLVVNVQTTSAGTGTAYNPTGVPGILAPAQTIAATATPYAPLIQLSINAATIAASGAAYNPTSTSYPVSSAPAQVATATSTSWSPVNLISPTSQVATATSTSYAPTITLGVQTTTPQAVGTSQQPVAQLKPNAATIAGSGTANNPSTAGIPTVNAPAQTIAATGTAYNPSITSFGITLAPAQTIAATATAQDPTASVRPSAQTIAATGTAYGTSVVLTANGAGLSQATGTALNPISQVRAQAATVAASGAAYGATGLGTPPVSAPAGLATGSGTAYNATAATTGSHPVPTIATTGTAYAPAATLRAQADTAISFGSLPVGLQLADGSYLQLEDGSILEMGGSGAHAYDSKVQIKAQGTALQATGTANNPTVATTSGDITVNAGLATSTGSVAYGPLIQLRAAPPTATAVGTVPATPAALGVPAQTIATSGAAYGPVAEHDTATPASVGTGTAYDTSIIIRPQAQLASASGSANSVSTSAFTSVSANAQVATATSAAYSTTVALLGAPPQAQATSTSYAPTIQLRINTPVIAATGSIVNPTPTLGAQTTTPAATGTAYTVSTTAFSACNAPAGLATATGAAIQASISTVQVISAPANTSTAVGTVPATAAWIAPNAQTIASTGSAAYGSKITLGAQAGSPPAVGSAQSPTSQGNANASNPATAKRWATLTWQSRDSTIKGPTSFVGGRADRQWALGMLNFVAAATNAPAGLATAQGTSYRTTITIGGISPLIVSTGSQAYNAGGIPTLAFPAAVSTGSANNPAAILVRVNAQTIAAAGTSYNPTIVAFGVGVGNAQRPTATGTAYNPTVVAIYVAAPSAATAIGTAYSSTISLGARPPVIAVAGTAYSATVVYYLIVAVPTQPAGPALGAAFDTTIALSANPPVITATGTAINAGINNFPVTSAPAQRPTATGTASNATVTAFSVTQALAERAIAVATPIKGVASIAPQVVLATATATALSTTTITLGTATTTFMASTLTTSNSAVSKNLTAAATTFTASTLVPFNDNSAVVDHRVAALGFWGVGKRVLVMPSPTGVDPKDRPWALGMYDRGISVVTPSPATTTFNAQTLTVTVGAVSTNLTAATTTFVAQTIKLNGKEIDLPSAATVTIQGQTLVTSTGGVTVNLDPATTRFGPQQADSVNAQRLGVATTTFTAQTLDAVIDRGSVSQFLPQPVQAFQGKLTTTQTALYTVPDGQFLVLKQMHLHAIGGGTATTRLWSVPRGGATSTSNSFLYDVTVTSIDQAMTMVFAPGEKIYGYCATNDTVTARLDGFLLSTRSLPTPKVFFRNVLTASHVEVAIIDPGRKGIVKYVVLANTTGTDRTVDLNVTTSGVAPDDGGVVLNDIAVPAHTSVYVPLTLVLDGGKSMTLKADTTNAVSANVSGVFA